MTTSPGDCGGLCQGPPAMTSGVVRGVGATRGQTPRPGPSSAPPGTGPEKPWPLRRFSCFLSGTCGTSVPAPCPASGSEAWSLAQGLGVVCHPCHFHTLQSFSSGRAAAPKQGSGARRPVPSHGGKDPLTFQTKWQEFGERGTLSSVSMSCSSSSPAAAQSMRCSISFSYLPHQKKGIDVCSTWAWRAVRGGGGPQGGITDASTPSAVPTALPTCAGPCPGPPPRPA